MEKQELIKRLTHDNACQIQTKDQSVLYTEDQEVARWAMNTGKVHVQGCYGINKYTAYIFVDQSKTKESHA